LVESHSPREKKNDLNIENDKNQGENIKTVIEFYPGSAKRVLGALVIDCLFGIRVGWSEYARQQKSEKYNPYSGQDED
jgi:hypothetical protein